MTDRRAAMTAGLLYLLTFAASFPALALLQPALAAGWVAGTGADRGVTTGLVLDLVNAGACVATAVVLLPVLRRAGVERLGLGFLTTRLLEAATIVTGVVALLALGTLRGDAAASGADPATLTLVARALVAVRDWTFLLGPGLMAGLNALLLASALRRTGLAPRWIPTLGLIGAPLHLAAVLASVYGLTTQTSPIAALAAAPVALWELSLGLRLAARGFVTERVPA